MSTSKINAIYDALDCRNYKLAIQLAEKVKSPNELVLALKSLALARSARTEEAGVIVDKILESDWHGYIDLNAINALYYTLKLNCDQKKNLVKMVCLYEKAVQLCPKDIQLNTSLFNALVRVDDWKMLSAQAVKLKNLAPASMTLNYLWVCSSASETLILTNSGTFAC